MMNLPKDFNFSQKDAENLLALVKSGKVKASDVTTFAKKFGLELSKSDAENLIKAASKLDAKDLNEKNLKELFAKAAGSKMLGDVLGKLK